MVMCTFAFIDIPKDERDAFSRSFELFTCISSCGPWFSSHCAIPASLKMGKLGCVFICLLVVALDVTAGILGIQAEVAQNKVRQVKLFIFECKEPSHQAYRLALSAAVLLAVAHAISHLLGGCICICSSDELGRSSPSRKLAAGALIFSWIVALVAFAMLLMGALSNSKSETKCGLKHGHVLSWGGILCFAHALLSVVYYSCAISSGSGTKTPA